jgi:FtsP/CotA-like multicopper oxidase with cupredoxin domain
MTEVASPRVSHPRIVVLGVQPSTPPFRVVEIDGEVVGEATNVADVVIAAAEYGILVEDLDDPDLVRWVGGDKFTWTLH